MSELREDLPTKDWVVFATERAKRPHDFRQPRKQPAAADYDESCRFCLGNESQTPHGRTGYAYVRRAIARGWPTGGVDTPAHVQLALTVGNGSVKVDGQVRVPSPGFAGRVLVADVSLPELLAAAGVGPAGMIHAGRLTSELSVEVGLRAAEDGTVVGTHDVRVRGRISLAQPTMTISAASPITVATGSLALDVTQLELPGVLPGTVSREAGAITAGALSSGDVHFQGQLTLTKPQVTMAEPNGFTAGADTVDLMLSDILALGVLPFGATAPSSARGELRADVQLSMAGTHVAITGEHGCSGSLGALALALAALSAQGFLAGAEAARRPDRSLTPAGACP